MKRITAAGTTLLLGACSASAVQAAHRDVGYGDKASCVVEVLHSEELPIGPLFYHTVKANLLVTAPGTPPFETTVVKVIPWQMPPPRQGQRLWVSCDPATLNTSFRLF